MQSSHSRWNSGGKIGKQVKIIVVYFAETCIMLEIENSTKPVREVFSKKKIRLEQTKLQYTQIQWKVTDCSSLGFLWTTIIQRIWWYETLTKEKPVAGSLSLMLKFSWKMLFFESGDTEVFKADRSKLFASNKRQIDNHTLMLDMLHSYMSVVCTYLLL